MHSLAEARDQRLELLLDESLSLFLGAKDVTPAQRFKLRHILAYYAKQAKPFTQCVRDNRKRFGPGAVERVCGTIVALIHRHNNTRSGHKLPIKVTASDETEPIPVIDDDVISLLDSLTPAEETALQEIYEAAMEVA